MNELVIELPAYGITRYYMISFMHQIDLLSAEIYVLEGNARIVSKRAPMCELLAETFQKIADVLREYTGEGEKRRVDIPASGNDRKIFASVKRDLHQSPESSFTDIFATYAEYLRSMNDRELSNEMKGTGGKYSAPSIFRPELYSFTRGPFFDGRLGSDEIGYEVGKYTMGGFLTRLGGYVVSRVGTVVVPGPGGRPRYLTTLMLPVEVHKITDRDFHARLGGLRKTMIPGLYPEEALVMWLSLSLSEDSPDLLAIGMEGPAGQAPAKVDVGVCVPLRSYRERAKRFLEEVEKRGNIDFLKYVISSGMRDQASTTSGSLLKLLFMASQEDARAAEELSLRVSKITLGNADTLRKAGKPTHVKVSEGILKAALPALRS